MHADDGGEQAGPNDAPGARTFALEQRREHAVRAVHPGEQVGDQHPDPSWLARLAGDAHQPGLALRDLVVAGTGALWTVVPEAGDREDHQAGVELVQAIDAEAEPVEDRGSKVLQDDVGVPHQPLERGPAVVGLEVEGDGLLVPVADR